MNNLHESAVSPVIAVLLMLVVTIIIAAVVSGFAGGLAGGTSKAASVSMKAEFSNTTGLTIDHAGGDVISTAKTKIFVGPTGDFGSYEQMRWEVNSTVLMITKKGKDLPWYDPTKYASSNSRTFQPGDQAILNATNLDQIQPRTYGSSGTTDAYSSSYGFRHSNAQGQRFNLMLVDDEGRTIAQTTVVIKP